MEAHIPNREEAFALVKEYNSNESLIKHALAVEGVMRLRLDPNVPFIIFNV